MFYNSSFLNISNNERNGKIEWQVDLLMKHGFSGDLIFNRSRSSWTKVQSKPVKLDTIPPRRVVKRQETLNSKAKKIWKWGLHSFQEKIALKQAHDHIRKPNREQKIRPCPPETRVPKFRKTNKGTTGILGSERKGVCVKQFKVVPLSGRPRGGQFFFGFRPVDQPVVPVRSTRSRPALDRMKTRSDQPFVAATRKLQQQLLATATTIATPSPSSPFFLTLRSRNSDLRLCAATERQSFPPLPRILERHQSQYASAVVARLSASVMVFWFKAVYGTTLPSETAAVAFHFRIRFRLFPNRNRERVRGGRIPLKVEPALNIENERSKSAVFLPMSEFSSSRPSSATGTNQGKSDNERRKSKYKQNLIQYDKTGKHMKFIASDHDVRILIATVIFSNECKPR